MFEQFVGQILRLVDDEYGGFAGSIVGFALLLATAAAIYIRSRRTKVDHKNVNAEWKGDLTAGLDEHGQPTAKVGVGVPSGNGEVTDAAPGTAQAKKAGMP